MKKVMVVIPVHNGVGMIERTLDSIEKQTFTNITVVVVDNCSNDGTADVVRKWGKKFLDNNNKKDFTLLICENAKNLGRIGNWNEALDIFRESEANYCKIMFVGDTIEPQCIEKQILFMETNYQMVTCAHKVIQEDNSVYEMKHMDRDTSINSKEALELSLKKGNWFAGTMGCVLFSKKVLGKNKFTDGLNWAGDWKFWCDLAMNTNIVYLKDVLATFYMDSRKGYKRMAGSEEAEKEENIVKDYITQYMVFKHWKND